MPMSRLCDARVYRYQDVRKALIAMGIFCDLRGLVALFVVRRQAASHDVSEDGFVLWEAPAIVVGTMVLVMADLRSKQGEHVHFRARPWLRSRYVIGLSLVLLLYVHSIWRCSVFRCQCIP